MSDTVCSVCYQSNKAVAPSPPTLLPPLSPSPLDIPCPLACICCNKLPVSSVRNKEGEQWRFVSRAVTRSQAVATKASTLIELRGREAARFGEALIDSLIGAEGFQKYALQSQPINQTIKPSLCSWSCSI